VRRLTGGDPIEKKRKPLACHSPVGMLLKKEKTVSMSFTGGDALEKKRKPLACHSPVGMLLKKEKTVGMSFTSGRVTVTVQDSEGGHPKNTLSN